MSNAQQSALEQVRVFPVPVHLGIIMDGNRRWAKMHALKAFYGHKKGYERLKGLLDTCVEIGIKYLTVYAFSSENFRKRSFAEKKYLFRLLKDSVREVLGDPNIMEKGVRINFFGRSYLLPEDLQQTLKSLMKKTEDNDNFFLNVCLVYDGQEEIVDAVRKIAQDIRQGKISPEQIDKDFIKANLYTRDAPPADLIIRTGMRDAKRLSGFLLWDSSYSEFIFRETLWPDYDVKKFKEDIEEFSRRQRRFGK